MQMAGCNQIGFNFYGINLDKRFLGEIMTFEAGGSPTNQPTNYHHNTKNIK
jgi:hypothetical protein